MYRFRHKNKILFLAFCIEYSRWYYYLFSGQNEPLKTYFPIQLDGTCNGFQHMALLSHQIELFDQVNLTKKSRKEFPADLYSYLKHEAKNLLLDKSEKDTGNKTWKRLANFPFDRPHVKTALMVFPYNASAISMVNYIEEKLYELPQEIIEKHNLALEDEGLIIDNDIIEPEDIKKHGKNNNKSVKNDVKLIKNQKLKWYSAYKDYKGPYINQKDIFIFVKVITDIISNNYKKVSKLKEYLNNVANIHASLNLPISWNLPNGLEVNQAYMKVETYRISPFNHSRNTIVLNKVHNSVHDVKKNKVSLMPNLIHSLDATSLVLAAYGQRIVRGQKDVRWRQRR